jgi:hypothetical protein
MSAEAACRLGLLAGLLFLAAASPAPAAVGLRQAGQQEGIWFWALPTTPGGTVPKQGWSGAGAEPGGGIYVGGMDHVGNAALYRLQPAARCCLAQP